MNVLMLRTEKEAEAKALRQTQEEEALRVVQLVSSLLSRQDCIDFRVAEAFS